MRITDVRVHALRDVPIAPPPRRDGLSRADVTILEIEDDDGWTGCALVEAGLLPASAIVEMVATGVAPLLVGEDPRLHRRLWSRLLRLDASGPAWLPLLAAADVATWDLHGKREGRAVWQLLGGTDPRSPAYLTIATPAATHGGTSVREHTLEELLDEARHFVDAGHTRIKLKVGRDTPFDLASDVAILTQVRATVGAQVELLIDGGRRLTATQAATLCAHGEDLDIAMFEEPVRGNQPEPLAWLRSRTTIALGANPAGRRDRYLELVRHGSVDHLQPNVATLGYTESMVVAELAEAAGLSIMNGNGYGPFNAHLQAASTVGAGVEYHYGNWMLHEALFDGVDAPAGGWVEVSDAPGTGMTLRSGIVDEHRTR